MHLQKRAFSSLVECEGINILYNRDMFCIKNEYA